MKCRGAICRLVFVAAVAVTWDTEAWAADGDFGSAILLGVGGAYTAAIDDAGALWLNPAVMGLSGRRGALQVSYRRLYELAALEEVCVSASQRATERIRVGLGFRRFGEARLYQETDGLAAVAYRIRENWSAGLMLSYQRVEYGDAAKVYSGASADAGIFGQVRGNIHAGGAIRRIVLDDLYEDATSDPPVVYEVSAAWSATPDLSVGAIWSHDRDSGDRFGLGQRLRLSHNAEFLSGLRFDPIRYSLGGRVAHIGASFDYVYQSHPDLGGTHVIGLGWRW